MIKIVKKEVEVKVCDICSGETTYLEKCSICRRGMCSEGGGAKHTAFSGEVYRYSDGVRAHSLRVCTECAEKPFEGTIGEFLSSVLPKKEGAR